MTTESPSSSMVAIPGVGQVSAGSIASARETYVRSYAPKEGESAEAIAAAREARKAQFDAALRPPDSASTAQTPAIADADGLRAIEHLGEMGLNPAVVETLRTKGFGAVSAAEQEFARNWIAQHKGDKEWAAKYLDGDVKARGQMLAASLLVSLPVANTSAADEQARRALIAARA